MQEAFARLHRAGHDPRSDTARPLLFAISKNLVKDRWRATRRAAGRRAGGTPEGAAAAWEQAPCEAPSADRQMIARQDLSLVAAAIRDLPPKCRAAFLLHRFEGLTYREIGDRLGVSVSMVEKHLAEALRR